ncbi:hypothetical protein SDC9_176783 [bioreactor metagenome]|uniref:Uncharacterized protein n=1 Tax=bioreactor metagenome TaxID=1076179 RepID=A0A645GSR1_9ZZZZ
MQVNGKSDGFLQPPYQGVGCHGGQQVCHVFDADGVGAHLRELLGKRDEMNLVMDGRDRIGDGGLRKTAVLFYAADGLFHVSRVVQRVEDPDDVNAVFDGFCAEGVHHVVGVVSVAQNALSPKQHLQLRVGQVSAQCAEPFPWILVQIAHTRVKGRAAPAFQRVVTD